MRRSRNRRPSSTRRRIAADGRRAISFSSARMASDVGPTHAAEPGIHGHPGNSCSGIGAVPSSHMRVRYVQRGFFPGRAQQPLDGARMHRASQLLSGNAAPPARSPTYFRRIRFAEASLRPATARRAARRARGAPAPLRPRPAEPGWRRPSAPSTRFRGRTANRHPDSVCSPLVGSTSKYRGWRKLSYCPLHAGYPHLENQRTIRRLRRRESSMTSVTPAPSQIAPCNREFHFVPPFVVMVYRSFYYRVLLRDRRRFRKRIMMPPAAIQMPACIIVSVIVSLLLYVSTY